MEINIIIIFCSMAWAAFGILGKGFLNSFMAGKWPCYDEKKLAFNRNFSTIMIIFGPLYLFVAVMVTGFGFKYGWSLSR